MYDMNTLIAIKKAEKYLSQVIGKRVLIVIKQNDYRCIDIADKAAKEAVCAVYKLTWDEINKKTRCSQAVIPRQVYQYIMVETFGIHKNEVAKETQLHRTTVLHNINTIKGYLNIKDPLAERIKTAVEFAKYLFQKYYEDAFNDT
ncbi:MAG: hypothetical protein N2747_00280 [Chitinophagaceae bacterium]|nr:hypothetical protein [Chitinophagaceae bacterium]